MTYDPVYQNDKPERIFLIQETILRPWLSTPGGGNANPNQLALAFEHAGHIYNGNWATDPYYKQRPVLYLNNL